MVKTWLKIKKIVKNLGENKKATNYGAYKKAEKQGLKLKQTKNVVRHKKDLKKTTTLKKGKD